MEYAVADGRGDEGGDVVASAYGLTYGRGADGEQWRLGEEMAVGVEGGIFGH